jgi:hypothetical protein
MRVSHALALLAACFGLASCATVPEPRPHVFELRTDPPSATCSLLRKGVVVVTVATTPATVTMPVDHCRDFLQMVPCWDPEKIAPLEVACRKEGFLEQRMTFEIAPRWEVMLEEGSTAPSRDMSGLEVLGAAAYLGLEVGLVSAAPGLAMAAVAAPMVVLPVLGVAAIAAAAAGSSRPKEPPPPEYVWRALPEFVLTPATFASAAACDAHFASLASRLEAARDAERDRIDRNCRPLPCEPSDATPCPDPRCVKLRAEADARWKAWQDEIPSLRARIQIAAP